MTNSNNALNTSTCSFLANNKIEEEFKYWSSLSSANSPEVEDYFSRSLNKLFEIDSISNTGNWSLIAKWLKTTESSCKFISESSSTVELERLQTETAILRDACQEDTALAKKTFTTNFLSILHESDFEYGFKTKADDYVQDAIENYGTFAREWINEVFLQCFDKAQIVTSLLRVISHFDYRKMYPNGMTMAAAAMNHVDIEVRECGVRCFENWEAPENLHILKSVTYSEKWLREYLHGVIEDLEGINS